MKIKLFLAYIILLSIIACTKNYVKSYSTEYYVDASKGNDVNDGKSSDSAWRTIDKVNKAIFLPGDIIHFKCGETWREQLNITSSGAVGAPIVFTSYGDNCNSDKASTKPLINAAVKINTGWERYKGSIYMTKVRSSVKQLFVNSQYLKLAQHPDSGYMIIDGNSETMDYLTDDELADSLSGNCKNNLKGAGIHIRTLSWLIEDREIKDFIYKKQNKRYELILSSKTSQPLNKGIGYYLDNKLCMLDQPGEWYFNNDTKKLYVWMPDSADLTNPDNNYMVEASTHDFGVNVISSDYISIDGVRIENSAVNGVSINNSAGFIVRNSDIYDSGGDGIYVHNSPNGHIANCLIKNSVNEGIKIIKSDGLFIIGNHVENSGTIGSPKNSSGAIVMHYSNNAKLKDNKVINSGYHGITFMRGTSIQNNVIENSCLVLSDCGGIYTWSGNVPGIAYKSQVVGNIIVNAEGNHDGTPSSISAASGIYLDDLSNDIDVLYNTVIDASLYGIYLHNTSNINVSDNSLYGNKDAQLSIIKSGKWIKGNSMSGNIIKNNILFPLNSNAPVYIRGEYGDTDLGIFESNFYSLLYSERVVHEVNRDCYVNKGDNDPDNDIIGPPVHYAYRLNAWRQQQRRDSYGNLVYQDKNAVQFDPFTILTYSASIANSDNYIVNGTFDIDVSFWSAVNGAVKEWIENCNDRGGCLKLNSSRDLCNSHFQSDILSLGKNKTYMVNFRARSNKPDQGLQVILRSNDYGTYFLDETVILDDAWRTYTFFIELNQNQKDARLDYFMPRNQTVYLDDISLTEVTMENNYSNDDAYAHILTNKSSQHPPEPIQCPDNTNTKCGQYIDLYGAPVVWPLKLAPYSSKIIVWKNPPL